VEGLTLASRAWGIDLGRSAVKGVLLTLTDDGAAILDADSVALEGPPPDPAQDPIRDSRLWKALHTFQDKHNLRNVEVCLAIPAQNTLVRDLTVARVSGRKLEQMVRYEASNEIPFVLDEVVWDYTLFDAAGDEAAHKGLLFAVKENVVQTYLRVAAQLGIDRVVQITLSPLALLSFVRLEWQRADPILVLDVGADNTDMLVVDSGRFWLRSLLVGGNRVTRELQERFDLEFDAAQRAKEIMSGSSRAEEFVRAIQPAVQDLLRGAKTSLSHLERESGLTGLGTAYMIGGASALPGLKNEVGRTLQQEVADTPGLKHVTVHERADASFVEENLGRLAVAVGAGLCALGRGATGVSFLPKRKVRAALLSRAQRLLAVVGIALWAVMTVLYVTGSKTRKAVEAPLSEYRELALIASGNERELAEAMERTEEEAKLQYLVAVGQAKGQPLKVLNDVVAAFSSANRRVPCRFQLRSFTCKERKVETAEAVPAGQADTVKTADAGAAGQSPACFVGEVKGRMVVPAEDDMEDPRGLFKATLLAALRNRMALAKASGQATFSHGNALVTTDSSLWSGNLRPGDLIRPASGSEWFVVAEVLSETELALTEPFASEDQVGTYVVSRVLPVAFDETTLDFALSFEVPKAGPLPLLDARTSEG
jgi:type IV pilus assembly protein PilM